MITPKKKSRKNINYLCTKNKGLRCMYNPLFKNKIFSQLEYIVIIFLSAYVRNESDPFRFLVLLGAAPHVLMQNSHPQQSPKLFLSRIYITILFHLRGRKKICESMKNAPIYRSAEIMQFVCELFNALVVFYTHSHSQTLKSQLGTGNSEREFRKHKYLRTKAGFAFRRLVKIRVAWKDLLHARTADNWGLDFDVGQLKGPLGC